MINRNSIEMIIMFSLMLTIGALTYMAAGLNLTETKIKLEPANAHDAVKGFLGAVKSYTQNN